MRRYRIEVYTDYRNNEGNYRKNIYESDYYQETVNKFNEIVEDVKKKYPMTLDVNELYDKQTSTYAHYFQVEMISQDYQSGVWHGIPLVEFGSFERFIGKFDFTNYEWP